MVMVKVKSPVTCLRLSGWSHRAPGLTALPLHPVHPFHQDSTEEGSSTVVMGSKEGGTNPSSGDSAKCHIRCPRHNFWLRKSLNLSLAEDVLNEQ